MIKNYNEWLNESRIAPLNEGRDSYSTFLDSAKTKSQAKERAKEVCEMHDIQYYGIKDVGNSDWDYMQDQAGRNNNYIILGKIEGRWAFSIEYRV